MASLDELAERAREGDGRAGDELYRSVRERLAEVARRRVRPEDVEDVVQESLRILHQRLPERTTFGVLPWSYSVLRNVIGNHYRSRRRRLLGRLRLLAAGSESGSPGSDPLVSVEATEVRERLILALDRLREESGRCGEIFDGLLEGLAGGDASAAEAAATVRGRFPGMTANAFHVALHRCRGKLKAILRQLEQPGP